AEIGYVGEWQCISAAQLGAPHQRERLFVVAYPERLFTHQKQPTCWADQVRTVVQEQRAINSFPTFEQRDDGVAYGLPSGLDNVPVSVPQGTPGRIRSRYLYGRSVVPACAAVAFRRIKFLEEWWRDARC
ncbi:MAG: DNA cytosine methyltransferase, partial [Nostoc sp.]